ncbi:hypothetical protein C8J57DRAFT_1087981 [Mycena rebaudengoi]|nr:hypothetical protein C8J57DRAFT_1087981 [Mycena rebaudengoi]
MGPNEGTVRTYAPLPFDYEFQKIVDTLGLYQGEFKPPETLVADLNSNRGSGGIDMVVLGTCEFDLREDNFWHKDLLSAWDTRASEHKFMLVCIAHDVGDPKTAPQRLTDNNYLGATAWPDMIVEWSRRNAIRILPISEHVAAAFRRSFLVEADSVNATIRSAGFEYIPIHVHVPVLDIPLADRKYSRVLSDAAIQGSFSPIRRTYADFFAELGESFARDPKAWGYLPLATHDASYIADITLPDPPFRLFLVGSGHLQIPHELQNVVVIHDGLNYPEYYELMSRMDICVPALFSNKYYDRKASSTFATAFGSNVPILVTERIKAAYAYANDDRAVVTRPAAMSEVEALYVLRTGDASYFYERNRILPGSPIWQATEKMMHLGWMRSKADFQAFKERIWRANEHVVEQLLRDL